MQSMKSRILSGAVVALVIGMAGASTFAHDGSKDRGAMPDAMAADMLARIDSNHDGSISAAEHAAHAQAMFAKMDANHDGSVDRAELAAGMKQMHRMHEGDGAMAGHEGQDASTPVPDAPPTKK
jgi:hypothetical protein